MTTEIVKFFRKPRVWGFVLSTVIIALIALAFFYPDNFEGNSLQQPDMQQGAANGHEGQVWEEQTGEKALWTNALFGGMPTFQISPSHPSNSLFTWINKVYGLWLPAPSNLLFMMMFGFLILMAALRKKWYYGLIGAIAWGFSSYFIIIIGAGHIWKFVALAYVPPTIAGLVMVYRGRYVFGTAITALFAMLQLNANHPQMSYYFGLVMAIMAICYLIDAIRRKKVRKWLISSGCLVLAGALALGANAPSLYNTYRYAKESKRAQSELAEASATQDSDATGGMPRSQIVGWSYGQAEMFSLLVPNIKGGATARPVGGQMVPTSLIDMEPDAVAQGSDAYYVLLALPQYFNNSEGTNGPVYVGAGILALFLLGCFLVKGPLKWAMIASTVVSLILALGYNAQGITDFMIDNFPLYNKFRAVESILVVAEFCIPVLAILGLSELVERGPRGIRHYATPITVSFGLPAAVCLLGFVAPSAFGDAVTEADRQNRTLAYIQQQLALQGAQQGIPEAMAVGDCYVDSPAVRPYIEKLRYGMVRSDAARSLAFVCVIFIALALYEERKLGKGIALTAIGASVLIDLYTVDKRYVSHDSFGAPVDSESQGIVPDAIDNALLNDTDYYRVLDIPEFNSARRSYFHHMIGGYHAAKLSRYDDIIYEKLIPLLTEGYTTSSPEARTALAVASMLNARYIITGDRNVPVLINSGAMGNAWLADSVVWADGARREMDALDADAIDMKRVVVADEAFRGALPEVASRVPGDSIYLVSYSPNKLEYQVDTQHGGIGVFSEVYFPWGWKADVDGAPVPISRVNYILRAIAVPAGSHRVTMVFDPDSIHTSSAAAYACVTLIYLLMALGVFVECRRLRIY